MAAAYEELIRQAADGEVVYNDDTTVKILELMKAIETDEEECEAIRKQIEDQKGLLEETRKKAGASAAGCSRCDNRLQAHGRRHPVGWRRS